jgi:hypothetical protein
MGSRFNANPAAQDLHSGVDREYTGVDLSAPLRGTDFLELENGYG